MAFTATQVSKIRSYLGYPSVYRYANPRLESAIPQLGADPDDSAEVIQLLADIDNVFTQLKGVALPLAGMKSADYVNGGVEWYPNNQLTIGVKAIGRTYVARLSGKFGVPIGTDIFGTAGYTGDSWKSNNGMSKLAGLG